MIKFIFLLATFTTLSLASKPFYENDDEIIGTVVGDLDKDGVPEKAQVVEYLD